MSLAYTRLERESIAAQIFHFWDTSVDAKGSPFHPTPTRVDAILWALALLCQWIDVPYVDVDQPA